MYKDNNENWWFGTAGLGIYQFDGTPMTEFISIMGKGLKKSRSRKNDISI